MDRRCVLKTVGLSAASAAGTYWLSRPRIRKPEGVYLQLGTSITAGLHGPGSNLTPITVGQRLNLVPINGGFDGGYVGYYDHRYSDDFSLQALSASIISGDWRPQDKSISFMGDGNGIGLANLKGLRLSDVTYIGLEYGNNDFTLNASLQIFASALDKSIKALKFAKQNAQVFLISPAWHPSEGTTNEVGATLQDYRNMMTQIGATNQTPCLDMRVSLGLTANNYKKYCFDEVHPNEVGARIRGEVISSFIQSFG